MSKQLPFVLGETLEYKEPFATVTTDLLVGLAIGIGTKLAMHLLLLVPLKSLFNANLTVAAGIDGSVIVKVKNSVNFTTCSIHFFTAPIHRTDNRRHPQGIRGRTLLSGED